MMAKLIFSVHFHILQLRTKAAGNGFLLSNGNRLITTSAGWF